MQEITLFSSVAITMLFGLLTVTKKNLDAMFVFLLFIGIFHAASFLYLFGISGSSEFLPDALQGDAAYRLSAIFTVFILSTYLSYAVFLKTSVAHALFPNYTSKRSDKMMILGIIVLTLMALSVSMYALYKAGGIFKAADLVRHKNLFEGLSVLKKIVLFATLLNAAYLIDLITRRRKNEKIPLSLIYFFTATLAVNLFSSFLMGGKGIVVFPLAFMLFTALVCTTKRPIRTFILSLMALMALVISLQLTRITLVKQSTIKNPINTVYGALHLNVLDTNLVFINTLGKLHHVEIGDPFAKGLIGIIPRSIWKNKPEQIDPGGAFKRSLKPGSEGAWPIFGYNQWYASYGWAGVIIGGILTGLIISAIQGRYARHRGSPINMYISFMMNFYLLTPAGIGSNIFINYIFFVAPLFIFGALTGHHWDKILKLRH